MHERNKIYREKKETKYNDFDKKYLGAMLNFDIQSDMDEDDNDNDTNVNKIIVESEDDELLFFFNDCFF